MEWLTSLIGLISAILGLGQTLEKWMDGGAKRRLGQLLLKGASVGLADWLQGLNQHFLNMFDGIYKSTGRTWEQSIWYGLVASPFALAAVHQLLTIAGEGNSETSNTLVIALVAVGGFAVLREFVASAIRDFHFSKSAFQQSDIESSFRVGLFIGIVGGSLGGIASGIIGSIVGSVGTNIVGGTVLGIIIPIRFDHVA